ncbi:MAG TPA: hypothetical protein VL022_07525 [Moheibacter sp.]|nr:hypothetical protein [Moheibacter sp.]
MKLIKTLLTCILSTLCTIYVHAQELKESELINYISNHADPTVSTQILQLGNNNTANIDGRSLNLIQQGNDQQFTYIETSLIPSELNVHVEGHNNQVEIIGNNQIMDQATINIQGDNRNVLIRNYP